MKISLILLPLLATLCAGVTLKFEKCELLDVEGEFTVKDNDGRSVTVPLKDGAVNATASECDTSLVVDFPNSLKWVLIFNKQDYTLNQLVKFRPSALFKNDTLSSTLLAFEDEGSIELKENTSYICQTATTRNFSPSKDFHIELNLQSIQVQAFDLPDGQFSPGEHCAEDEASSTPSTPTETTPKTPSTSPSEGPTTPSEGPTTPSEGPTSPEAPTTEPPKGMLTFRLKNKENKTCILMESRLDILMFYLTTKGSAMAVVPIPEKGFKVNGTCPAGNAATLEVMFGKNSMRFHFGDSNGQAELSQITMTIDMDPDLYPNATVKTLELATEQTWNIPLGDDKTFFFCNADQSIPLIAEKGNASLSVANLKVQAFNFAGETFSGTGEDCDADKSTTPTPTPTPSPPPADVPNNYTVKDDTTKVTCIRVKSVMNLTIPYNTTEKKMMNASVVVPHEFKVMGNCNASATTQTMTVTFFEDWKLEFAFTSNVSSKVQASQVGADPTYFAIESIKLAYKLDHHFPNAASANETRRAALQVPEGGLKAQTGGSYMCNSDVTFGGSGGASLQTTSFQYMAFNNNNKTADFPDSGVTECSQDLKDNSVVPIAVGAALAALVIIVLIAYLIGRRRSRRSGYESV